ncbi:hypothetical protein SARC_12600 [Sphaeroforma arctica JP610]|uniref:TatD DNase n=1 Tax=Sphaeroforma arctica JP610 TaxID=667725 RepID=A0A0L0FDL6_9EUKA|nr:hypothetical protein SARC_12600 [Sphaeroforma arctica JP610]KNC74862.1 hypothetical protein SARC_12600 [Sphaeroforma arctica JP610]|eukprot:XP_014148764.1 hypothetical protein SARC_12600 [Sphaeroforma arctica JP610]
MQGIMLPRTLLARRGPSSRITLAQGSKNRHVQLYSCLYSTVSRTYIDTHTHLDMILKRLRQPHTHYPALCKEVHLNTPMEACIHVSCSPATFEDGLRLVENYDNVYGAFGVHPKSAKEYNLSVAKRIRSILLPTSREASVHDRDMHNSHTAENDETNTKRSIESGNNKQPKSSEDNTRTAKDGRDTSDKPFVRRYRAIALGECGLDYSQRDSWGGDEKIRHEKELQKRVFIDQIQLAVKLNVPLVIHTREAEDDTLEILMRHLPSTHPTHLHCFTSHVSLAVALLKSHTGLCIGFTGAVTFKSAHVLRNTVRKVPLNRILLETDGPFMAPEPHRGKTCVPSMIPYIAECVAKVKGVDASQVYEQARINTHKVYGI